MPSAPARRSELEQLRLILAAEERRRIDRLTADFERLTSDVEDPSLVLARVAPHVGELIERAIVRNRAAVVEALAPLIGTLVARAVRDAVADLSRRVDAQARAAFDLHRILWRLRARFGGADAVALREALPFAVGEVLLIHRSSGLLLGRASAKPVVHGAIDDAELVAGMLTAVRGVAGVALGDPEGELEEIQVGDRRIVLETGRHCVLALAVDGVAPPDWRDDVRAVLTTLERAQRRMLEGWAGEVEPLSVLQPELAALLHDPGASTRIRVRDLMAAAVVVMLLCLAVASAVWSAIWTWRAAAPWLMGVMRVSS